MLRTCRFFALIATLLIACTGLAEPTLHFWMVGAGLEDQELYTRLGNEFEKTEHVKVSFLPLPWGSFKFKYLTAMAAGLPPDVGITNNGGPYDYGIVSGVVDLRTEFPDRVKELEDRYYPATLPLGSIGNHLYGVPFDTTTPIIFYRTDTFQKLGLSPPTTISEYNHVLNVLDANGYMTYFEFPSTAAWSLSMYTMPYGKSSVHMDAQGKPTVDWLDPLYQKGVVEALNLWWMHLSPGQNLNGGGGGVFAADNIGTATPVYVAVTDTFTELHINKPALDGHWAMATWPIADGGKPYNIMAGTSLVIFRDAKLKKAAFDWIMFLTSMPVQHEIVLDHLSRGENSSCFFSTVRQAYEPSNDAFWNSEPKLQAEHDLVDVYKKVLPSFNTQQGVPGSEDVGPLEQNFLDSVGSFIQSRQDEIAARHGISRREVIEAFGQGKYQDEYNTLENDIRDKVASGYKDLAPKAMEIFAKESGEGAFYADVSSHFAEAQAAPDALKVAKWVALLIFVGYVAFAVGPKKNRANLISYLLIAPPLALSLIFVFIPAAVALYISFTKYHPVLPLSAARWNGIDNYREVIGNGDLPASLWRTGLYAVVTVPIGMVVSLVFAFLLNNRLRAQRWWRFIFFSPMVTGVVSIALIFTLLLLDSQLGWLNALLLDWHWVKDPIQFLTSEKFFLPSVMALAIWQGLAFSILVFLAGLQQVPEEQFEAAEMDGAGQVRKFWNVAVPGIRPQVFFMLVLGVIGSFQVFDTIYTLAGKSGGASARFGPEDAGQTVVPLLYHYGFESFEMGKAAAVAYVLFVITILITMIQLWLHRRGEV